MYIYYTLHKFKPSMCIQATRGLNLVIRSSEPALYFLGPSTVSCVEPL